MLFHCLIPFVYLNLSATKIIFFLEMLINLLVGWVNTKIYLFKF